MLSDLRLKIFDAIRAVGYMAGNYVSIDADFQRAFNGFYIVRRNEAWRKSALKHLTV